MRIDPMGEARADLRIAQLCALVFNAARDSKKVKATSAADWMLKFDGEDEPKRQSMPAMMMQLKMIGERQNAKVEQERLRGDHNS